MAARKPFLGEQAQHPELDRLLEETRGSELTEDELREQRISFAYGNAPADSSVTKEFVRAVSKSIRFPGAA